jgi:hypothetical protein
MMPPGISKLEYYDLLKHKFIIHQIENVLYRATKKEEYMKKITIIIAVLSSGCAGHMSPEASAALMQWGAQMSAQSQPRALISAPPAYQPMRTNCVQFANGYTSCNSF